MEKTVKVKFLKSPTAYGFGYNENDCAEISSSKYKKLEKLKVVQEISDAEFKKYQKDTYGIDTKGDDK